MGRWRRPRPAAGWSLVMAMAAALAPPADADDWLPGWPWSWATPSDPKMAAIVDAVRAEEAKFADLEFDARITVRSINQQNQAAGFDVTSIARRRVVLQGGASYFHQESFQRNNAIKFRHEETSAFDGERTRTVVAGNVANIHLGRWRHPLLAPPHALTVDQLGVHFPLSIYLAGTRAIHAYLEYPPGLAEAMPWQTFWKVEAVCLGEEEVDGLRCVKVGVYRWYNAHQLAVVHHLWLARDRNYHCVREETQPHPNFLRNEMRVHELRELRPGIWLPSRFTSTAFQQVFNGNQRREIPFSRTETIIEGADPAPRHHAAFFRDVPIPDGLPVFTIRDRLPVDAMPPRPLVDDESRQKMHELVVRVAGQERRYDDTEVRTRTLTTYPRRFTAMQNVRFDELSEERSIVRGDMAYQTIRNKLRMTAGWRDTYSQNYADDGEWIRNQWWQGVFDPQNVAFILQRSPVRSPRGYVMHRPHRALVRRSWNVSWLTTLLEPGPESVANQGTPGFLHGGAIEVDGRPCIRIVEAPLPPNDQLPPDGEHYAGGGMLVLDLATDRNDIPVRVESYQRLNGRWPVLTFLATCGDFREIAPGTWYPFRATESTLDYWAMLVDGWAVIDSRRETTVESAGPASRVSDAVFRDVTVPAGATIQVLAESGQTVGQVEQPEDGVPWLSRKRYLALSSHSQKVARAQGQPRRWMAFQQPVVREPPPPPAPEFPREASWRNGGPSTRESLRGRVAVLVFWAEWDEDGRDAMARLDRLHREAGRDGPTVIGVHPPGSEPREVDDAIAAMKLGFPTMLDADGGEKATAWGRLAGQLDVRAVPYALVVDREGKVVARGTIDKALEKVRELAAKKR